jgi:hypothetical protein
MSRNCRDISCAVQPSGAAPGRRLILVRLRLFDQHHGYPVDDRIDHLALGAAKLIGSLELDFRVAFGAGQDFEQLARDHLRMVVRFLA